LAYASWRRRFGGDSTIIGRVLKLDGAPATVVGVLPRDFTFLGERMSQELFAPKILDSIEVSLHGSGWYHVVARLAPGASIAQANADVNRVAAQLAREFPKQNGDLGVNVVALRDAIVGDTGRALLLMLGAAGLVLLIACA